MMKENSQSKQKKGISPVFLIDQDEQKKKNFQLIGKMFGNMTESVNINNLSTNNAKDNSNKFSGGFKQQSILKNNMNKSTLQQKDNNKLQKIDVFTVYDQFGLLNESVSKTKLNTSKPKYRQDSHTSSNINNQSSLYRIQQTSVIDQMKDNRRKEFDKVMNNNYVNLHEYYDLAAQKDRQQMVIHVKSSLDNMTLQNVEAKLQAHRRQLKQIQNQYKSKKGIKIDQANEEQEIQKSYSNNFKQFTKTGQNDLYKQYGKTQSQIYQMIKKNQKDDQKELEIDHMWEQKLKQNPKLAEYSKKYQEYLVQKDAKNIMFGTIREKLFKWDKFTQPEHKHSKPKTIKPKLSKQKLSKQKNKLNNNQSLQKYDYQNNQLTQQALSKSNKNISQVLASKDDKFVAKYIFAQVDVDKKGLLSKQQLLDFMTKNQYIIKSYNIDMKWIYTDLDNYETKRKGMLNRQELAIFLATFQRIAHPEIKLKNVSDLSNTNGHDSSLSKNQKSLISSTKKQTPFQIYFPKDLYRFRNLFQKLDLNEDKILKRQQFIQNIHIDPDCSKIIDNVVIKIKIIQKDITYRQLISFVLDDYRNQKNQKLKKSKEYITFDRFCQYFQFPQSINLKLIGNKKKKVEAYPTNQHEIFDIEEENLIILKDLFDTIPRVYQDYIVAADFVQCALIDPQVLSFQEEMCRIQSVQTDLPIETVRLTLLRIIKQSDQYINWQAMKLFFSRRGRPLQWNQQLIKKKKQIRMQQKTKSINQALKKQLIMKNQFQISAKLNAQHLNRQQRTSQQNYTIPQPFKITDQEKTKKDKKKIKQGQAQFKQLNKGFKAKPVNKQILQPKPDLILGKRAASSSKKLPQYNYENYQNDRIQRALKRAQQQYEQKQRQQQIKDMANIKVRNIGIDLTKGYLQVLKQNQKKQKQSQTQHGKKNKPLTQLQQKIAKRLHPSSKIDEQKKKLQKIKQKIQKSDQADQKAKKSKQKHNLTVQDKQRIQRQNLQKLKKQNQKKQRQRQSAIAKPDQTFKPKITKKQLSQKQKQAIQKSKQARTQKQQQAIQKSLQQKQQRRKKILQRQLKDPYLKTQQLSPQQIIQKIYEINIFNLILEQDKQQFNQDYDFQNKDKKQRQKYLKGVANKFKIMMSNEQKTINDLKVRQKVAAQKQKTKPKQDSTIRGKSDKLKKDLICHQSKALKRYREIIDGTAPSQVPSQYDRYGQNKRDDFDDEKSKRSNKILEQEDQEQINQQQNQEV